MAMDPYSVLGVSHTASLDDVKKAYRKKARENHPDLNPNDAHAAERMNEINEAYDRIMNPDKYVARDRRESAARGAGASYGSGYSSAGGTRGASAGGAGGAYSGTGGTGGTGGTYSGTRGGAGGAYSGTRGGATGGSQGYAQGNPYTSGGPYGWAGGFGFDFEDLFGFGGMGGAVESVHPEVSSFDSAEVRAAINAINAGQHKQAVDILAAITSGNRNARWYYLSALANHGAGNTVMALDQIRRAVRMDPQNQDYQRAYRMFQQTGERYTQTQQERGFTISPIDPTTICCGCCLAQMLCQQCMRFGVGF